MQKPREHIDLDRHSLATSLTPTDREFLFAVGKEHHLSFQQGRMLVEAAIDLHLWQEGPLEKFWDEGVAPNLSGKPRTKAIIEILLERVDTIRKQPTDYHTFEPNIEVGTKTTHIETSGEERLLGRCPCPVSGERTRCCNLLTLDAVRQCAFACSYCSIQSFYHQHEILFATNLPSRLREMELPEGAWHIGTGQASDSLLWGNAHGVLDAIIEFSVEHPRIVVELKTKSSRTDWITETSIPRNMVATWSLNAPTIAMKEEHGTASVEKRLEAAARAAQEGIAIGFHLHPMVYFAGWEDEYGMLIERITGLFDPRQVVMISLGTLTFTKEVLRELRSSGRPSKILQMELVESAGKYSYPEEVKQRLFSHAYTSFPQSWKGPDGPFFYLCMELPQLWEPVLGRSYPDNASFELDMRRHYYRSLGISAQGRLTNEIHPTIIDT